ncbi:MAG: Hsp20 family protein [Pseudomonadota bacterium]
MRTANFAPLYRSTVGFDHLFRLLDAVADGSEGVSGYPPYNIVRTGENAYEIALAVAGFTDADLSVEVKENALKIRGGKDNEDDAQSYLHRGIAQRAFERRFQLAEFVEVTGADLSDGMLRITLQRNLPERMKPRTIAISQKGANASRLTADVAATETSAA